MSKPEFSAEDHFFMARALEQAERGRYLTSPNPSVGCVIVRDGLMIGAGHTLAAGQDHAEIQALKQCAAKGIDPAGATAYVTLEPCSHFGRTPPCADALVKAGLRRVVAACTDPFEQVAGRGLARLREAGIETSVGLLEAEAELSLRSFFSRLRRGRPWLRLKIAMSLDGKTALANGESKWITGPQARADVQRWRARSCAMLTGVGTILADDPLLTVRDFDIGRQPTRIIVDSRLRTPITAATLRQPGQILLVCGDAPVDRQQALEAAGATVLRLPGADGRVDLVALVAEMGRRSYNEITVEAGATLNGALLQAGVVDELLLYQAPILLGGAARNAADLSLAALTERISGRMLDRRQIGADTRYLLARE